MKNWIEIWKYDVPVQSRTGSCLPSWWNFHIKDCKQNHQLRGRGRASPFLFVISFFPRSKEYGLTIHTFCTLPHVLVFLASVNLRVPLPLLSRKANSAAQAIITSHGITQPHGLRHGNQRPAKVTLKVFWSFSGSSPIRHCLDLLFRRCFVYTVCIRWTNKQPTQLQVQHESQMR
jgi:hypothetical protein